MVDKKRTKDAAAKPKPVAAKTEAPKRTRKPVTDDKDTSTAEPVVTVGPTGLCLQCNKPADHIHAGV